MAKNKKGKTAPPQGKNGYLERKKIEINIYRQAERETHIQYLTDMLILTLNDPEVMGKDTFGKVRLKRVIDAWGKKFDDWHGCLEVSEETDYWQIKLDSALREICGEEMHKFGERYPWVKDQTF